MVNKDRMVDAFMALTQIDSLTLKEREMADTLKKKLEEMGLVVQEDDTAAKIGGNTGNLLCLVEGDKKIPACLLMAHMDTVEPGKGKKPCIEQNVIKSDGSTILGADDVAGIVCILEAIKVLKEQNLRHGDIQVVFTVAEEGGLWGAKHLDYSKIKVKYGFVLDHGKEIGDVSVKAPSQDAIEIVVMGKAAHAGVEPEKGISAISIAAKAISNMQLGRIDEETTANIGVINGGQATNIVCDKVSVQAEARSRNEQKLDKQTAHMQECFEKAAADFGGKIEFKAERMYNGFEIKESEDIITVLKKAAEKSGIPLKLAVTGGGSDTNILNKKGIKAVNISVGMDKVHTLQEKICVDDLVKAADFIVSVLTEIE